MYGVVDPLSYTFITLLPMHYGVGFGRRFLWLVGKEYQGALGS